MQTDWQRHWFDFADAEKRASSCWPVEIVSEAHLDRPGVLEYAVVTGPVCSLLVAWQSTAIVLSQLLQHKSVEETLAEWRQNYPQQQWSAESRMPFAVEALLNGDHGGPIIPLAMDGTAFQLAVWKTLLLVPPGQIVSYGSLAAASGFPRGARAVGTAMADNPIPSLVPCHRVIRSDGQPGRYGSGTPLKVQMLQWETRHCCNI